MDQASYQSLKAANNVAPSPTDFDNFLPWVCNQLGLEVSIVVFRTFLSEYVSVVETLKKTKGKAAAAAKAKHPSSESTEMSSKASTASDYTAFGATHEDVVLVETVYDSDLKIVEIKFLKNKKIPQQVFKILGLMIPYHPTLHSIVINSGIQMMVLYEISKFLQYSHITEICLDYTFICEANYHVLLGENDLKVLSISKCRINDSVVKTIAAKLVTPCRASQTLTVLNLATNRITDIGAKYLAEAIRTNRQLAYLNISDNLLTDKGAGDILDALKKFPLTAAELKQRNQRYMDYLKEKQNMIMKTVKELRNAEFAQRAARRKSAKAVVITKKKTDSKTSSHVQSTSDLSASLYSLDRVLYQKANVIVNNKIGPFKDPFSLKNTVFCNGIAYCYGNNTLSYLNVAYNDLTYFSIKKLYQVLTEQKELNRKRRGLVNVRIDGNFMPRDCVELHDINKILEAGLAPITRHSVFQKKVPTSSK